MWRVANADGTPTTGEFEAAFPRVMNDMQFLTAASVADIDGDGLPEVIEGSDVYDVHAFNIAGVGAAGLAEVHRRLDGCYPGDRRHRGDGYLDVVTITREGSLFAGSATGGECSDIPGARATMTSGTPATTTWIRVHPPRFCRPRPRSTADTGGLVDLNLSAVPGSDLYCGAARISTSASPRSRSAAMRTSTPRPRLRFAAQPDRRTQSGRHARAAGTAAADARRRVRRGTGQRRRGQSFHRHGDRADDDRRRTDADVPADHTPQRTPTPTITPTPTVGAVLAGDCSGTGVVAITDIITLVNIDLGNTPTSACPYGIPSGSDVDIDPDHSGGE